MTTQWKQFRLVDVASISDKRVAEFEGQKRYVATGDVDLNRIVGGEEVTYTEKPSRADLLMKSNEVLFAKMKDTLKVVAGSDDLEDIIFSTGFYVLTPSKNLSKKFLYMFLLSDYFNRQKDFYCTGATMSSLNQGGLLKIKINLPINDSGEPNIFEQEHIANFLEEVEKLKEKRAEANKKMAQLIPALFTKMFGAPSNWPSGFKMKPLRELVDVTSGGTPSTQQEKYWNGLIPWVSAKDMKTSFIKNSIDHVTSLALKDTNLTYVEPDSVLIVVRGMILARYVPICVAADRLTINQDLKALAPKNNEILGSFLWGALQGANRQLGNLVKTAAHGTKKLDTSDLLKYEIPVPPKTLQEKFTAKVQEVRLYMEKQVESSLRIDELFSTLLSKAFDGQLINRTEATTPVQVPIKIFPIQQAMGLTLQRGFERGEMVLDKVLYLAQEVFGVSLSIPFAPYKLGPWSIKVKDAVNGGMSKKSQFFKRKKIGQASVLTLGTNSDKLFSPYSTARVLKDMGNALDQLLPIIKFWKSPEIECLATVCKVIQDIKSVDFDSIEDKINIWKPNKFSKAEIKKAFDLIQSKGWHKILINQN